jgi:3-phosphoshikimate 1-carboxyvinyltransferase
MKWIVQPATLAGATVVPGDKSIAHRALMFAALAAGESSVMNLPHGEDVLSTAGCMQALGAQVEMRDGTATVRSDGALHEPSASLNAGNSGTTMRLLTGILAGQRFDSCLDGDSSLRRRPMSRVVDPLRAMGADITAQDGRAPLDIRGSSLHGISYTLPVPSAQVKSAVLLAGLFAQGRTTVHEVVPARDHTERMMQALGLPVHRRDSGISVEPGTMPAAFTCHVPGDISSAAFLLAGAAIGGGEVTVHDVGLNPTRSKILDVLERMGATVSVRDRVEEAGELRGSVTVRGAISEPIEVKPEEIPSMVDELPLIALLATQVEGSSVVRGARELRVKETDRISAVASQLHAMGADITENDDGWQIRGGTGLRGASVQSFGDHRMAMMLAIAASVARGTSEISGAEAASVSFPNFGETYRSLGGSLESV